MKISDKGNDAWLRKESFDRTMKSLKDDNIIYDVIVYVSANMYVDLKIDYRYVECRNRCALWVTNDERRRIIRHISNVLKQK